MSKTREKIVFAGGRVGVVIAAAVVLTRLPFLGHGYGSDPDAWRAIIAARHFLDTGVYVPSRLPGNPLPEFVDAGMQFIGLGSNWWVGLLAAILSGVAAALLFHVLSPLGVGRAAAGAIAFAFTPTVFVASLGAMDYLWGLAFFLAATVFASQQRVWWMGVFLGLAVASRPSYALAVIPLVLLFDRRAWRGLVAPVLLAALIAMAFYLPETITNRGHIFWIAAVGADPWKHALFNGSVGLFGVIGFVAVAATVVLALTNRRSVAVNVRFDRWAWALIVLYGALFVRLPMEAAYLLPAALGLYWLLCRYTPQAVLWVMSVCLLVSCFVLNVGGQPVKIDARGPVLLEMRGQDDITCVGEALKDRLATDYVIVGTLRPQLIVQVGHADHLLYAVRRDQSGRLQDTDASTPQFPQDAHLWLLDRGERQQSEAWANPPFPVLTVPCS